MDISNEEGFFEFNLADKRYCSLNYRFTLSSNWGRGHTEYLMITVVTSTLQQTTPFQVPIEQFVKAMKANSVLYKGLYDPKSNNDPEIANSLEKIHELFLKCNEDCKKSLKECVLGHIAFIGLYRVGKTSLLELITKGVFDSNIRPTLGVQIVKFMVENFGLMAYDIGGQTNLKLVWDQIKVKPKAIIYVLDANAKPEQNAETRQHFDEVITHFYFTNSHPVQHIPLLILANKKDLNPTIDKTKVEEILQPNRYDIMYNIGIVSARTAENVFENFRWLMQQILFCTD
jgi:GTPase SAR1 family protein